MPYGMGEGQLGFGHWAYIIFPVRQSLRQNKESEENAPRFIPHPLTINRGLIESSPSTGFEPMTHETWSSPNSQSPAKALVLLGGIKMTWTGIWPRPQREGLLFLWGGRESPSCSNDCLCKKWPWLTGLKLSQDLWVIISAHIICAKALLMTLCIRT